MTITSDELIKFIKETYPDVEPYLRAYTEDDECGLYIKLIPFYDFLKDSIPSMTENELKKLCGFIEKLITDGDEEVACAACVGILESLMNLGDAGKIDFPKLAKFLGPESREYCLAWDAFCGCESHWNKKG